MNPTSPINHITQQANPSVDMRLRLATIVRNGGPITPPDVRAIFWGELSPNVVTNDTIRRALITLLVQGHMAENGSETGYRPTRDSASLTTSTKLIITRAGIAWMEGVLAQRAKREGLARAARELQGSRGRDGAAGQAGPFGSGEGLDGQSIPTVAGPRVHHSAAGEVYRPPAASNLHRARPGCLDFLQAPSRMGDRLVYRDGVAHG